MASRYLSIITLVLLAFFVPQPVLAADDPAGSSDTLSLYLENDAFSFNNRDRHYTHGTKISWLSRDVAGYRDIQAMPALVGAFVDRLPVISDAGRLRTLSFSLGQNIYTPEARGRTDLIVDDRPYAGVLYLEIGLHSRNRSFMDSLGLVVGLVGPHSYAQDVQKIVHQWTHDIVPRGWKHQLQDEPIVGLYIERKWRLKRFGNHSGFGLDVIPHAGLGVGNAYTGFNAGGQVRFGWNIPHDFGTYLIRQGSDANAPDDDDPRLSQPLSRFGIHGFLAVDGRAVARNIFLDGNTFVDSHRVDKNFFVADCIGGVGMIIHRVKITYALVYRTREFKTQSKEELFGSISLSYTF